MRALPHLLPLAVALFVSPLLLAHFTHAHGESDVLKEASVRSNNPLIRLPALCTLPKHFGECAKNIQRFYFEPAVGICVAFLFSGCGGNENNFDTREECENACMPLEGWALCADARSMWRMWESSEATRPDCVKEDCPEGMVCISDSTNTACCNATIEGFYEDARSSECAHGKRAFRSAIFSNLVFGVDCSELLCGDEYQCDRINPLFVKCCSVKPTISTSSVVTKKRQSLGSSAKSKSALTGELRRDDPLPTQFSMQECHLPKDSGACYPDKTSKLPAEQQQFFYDPQWQSCFAFKYSGCGGNGNRFSTRIECERACFFADGSVCKGPFPPVPPLNGTFSCLDTVCPSGYACAYGFGFVECCNSTILKYVNDAYSSECPDGTPAGGVFDEYFMATFAKTCDDLICNSDQRCVQVSPEFAKCCGRTVQKKLGQPSEGAPVAPVKTASEIPPVKPLILQPYSL